MTITTNKASQLSMAPHRKYSNLPKTKTTSPTPEHRKISMPPNGRSNVSGPKQIAQPKITSHMKIAPRPKANAHTQRNTCSSSSVMAKTAGESNVKAEAKLAKQIALATIEIVEDEKDSKPFSISASTYKLRHIIYF